jgi:hypothetical protein
VKGLFVYIGEREKYIIMAIVTLNPIFSKVSGRMGNVVFYRRQGKDFVRMYVIPGNPDTEAQRTGRRAFADAVKKWQSMTPDERYKYNRNARCLNMSGYNLFLSGFMKERLSAERKTGPGINPILEGIRLSGNMRSFLSVSPSHKEQFAEIYHSAGINRIINLQCGAG